MNKYMYKRKDAWKDVKLYKSTTKEKNTEASILDRPSSSPTGMAVFQMSQSIRLLLKVELWTLIDCDCEESRHFRKLRAPKENKNCYD